LLTSVQMEVDGDRLTLMATDRYRLAVREMTWASQDKTLSTHALLKARTLSDVAKSLTSTGDVTVALTEAGSTTSGLIGFEAGGRRTTSLLTDGDYP
ncbi:DNA polymerase III subunit beta, partial [human gut metagenome]